MTLDGGLQLSRVVRAADGTRKLVFTLTEGEAAGGSIETVLIPIIRQQGLRDRLTICVSSQVINPLTHVCLVSESASAVSPLGLCRSR